jgi:hypothetical protein
LTIARINLRANAATNNCASASDGKACARLPAGRSATQSADYGTNAGTNCCILAYTTALAGRKRRTNHHAHHRGTEEFS